MKIFLFLFLLALPLFAETTEPTDAYGRTVILTTVGSQDNYNVGGAFTVSFPHGTSLTTVYAAINSMAPPGFSPTYTFAPYAIFSPSAGSTVTVPNGVQLAAIYSGSALLSSLTINFPTSPVDGDELTLATNVAISTLTLTPGTGQTIIRGISTVPAGGGTATWKYFQGLSLWFRRS